MDDENGRPRVCVHIRMGGESVTICVCKGCRRYTDPEIIQDWGTMAWEYRVFKRQRRMRRKMKRGWA